MIFSLTLSFAVPGLCFDRSGVTAFAELPEGSTTPEGLTVDKDGNVYTATFDMARAGKAGQIIVFDKTGRLLRVLNIPGASNLLLDLAFHPQTGALLVVDFGGKKVLRVDTTTGASTVFMTIPKKTPTSNPGPNAPAFDKEGNVYVSDSFQGIVWRTGPNGGEPVEWLNHELLRTTGVPRFGANGLAFNKAGNLLFIANTGNRQIVKVPVESGAAGEPSVFVNSVGGPDGLQIDGEDRIWATANQNNEVVVIDMSGRVIGKLGDFNGIDEHGAVRGLLFPGALYLSGDYVYVSNLAFDMRKLGAAQTIDGQWAQAVHTHTIARIRIPGKLPNF